MSEEEMGRDGAASEGRTGVDVWRFRGGVRRSGSLGWVQGFATSEDIMSAVTGREELRVGVTGSGVILIFGVIGRD